MRGAVAESFGERSEPFTMPPFNAFDVTVGIVPRNPQPRRMADHVLMGRVPCVEHMEIHLFEDRQRRCQLHDRLVHLVRLLVLRVRIDGGENACPLLRLRIDDPHRTWALAEQVERRRAEKQRLLELLSAGGLNDKIMSGLENLVDDLDEGPADPHPRIHGESLFTKRFGRFLELAFEGVDDVREVLQTGTAILAFLEGPQHRQAGCVAVGKLRRPFQCRVLGGRVGGNNEDVLEALHVELLSCCAADWDGDCRTRPCHSSMMLPSHSGTPVR